MPLVMALVHLLAGGMKEEAILVPGTLQLPRIAQRAKFVAENVCRREQLRINYLNHERKQRGGYHAWR